MNQKQLTDIITKEVMNILKSSGNVSANYNNSDVSISGKNIIFLLPNIDVDTDSLSPLVKAFKTKNSVKAVLPKWGRTMVDDKAFEPNSIEKIYTDFSNPSNGKNFNGDIFIVLVNNDNVLRKISKLDKSTAWSFAITNAQTSSTQVYILPSSDYSPSENLASELGKTRAKLVNINDLNKIFLSAPTPKMVASTVASISSSSISNASAMELAPLIDHTLLKPEATEDQINKLCSEAREYKFASVCVNPSHVSLCAKLLQSSGVMVCTVIGFPLGATTSETKAFEARQAIAQGADEIDMVINVGALKNKEYEKVENDIRAVVQACNGKTLKVILETSLLTDEEKIKGCELSVKAKASFVKTSTGFGGGGATAEDIALMRRVVGPNIGVKASGAIRDTETALRMVKAGANRIGASSSVSIVKNEKPSGNSKY